MSNEPKSEILLWVDDEKVDGQFATAHGFQYLTNPIGYILSNPSHGYIGTFVSTYPKQDCESHARAVAAACTPKWISVEDETPDDGVYFAWPCIGECLEAHVAPTTFNHEDELRWLDLNGGDITVTHFMRVPAAPDTKGDQP